ncbi:MAG TPA: hypothetical protein ENK13_03075 [Thermopetrobacter sp.]|nr:hypothetical protein [Thermopetrobacter sp.]
MGEVFERAIAALRSLPDEERERLSWEIIQRVESKNEWDTLTRTPGARKWMREAAEKALREYRTIARRLGYSQLSVPVDNVLRESSYWAKFDELPDDIRRLAEENYQLWRQNRGHPRLRFKQVMDEPKVFSFRVGLRHRTLGVETPDGHIAWFWVGSIDDFRRMTAAME